MLEKRSWNERFEDEEDKICSLTFKVEQFYLIGESKSVWSDSIWDLVEAYQTFIRCEELQVLLDQ